MNIGAWTRAHLHTVLSSATRSAAPVAAASIASLLDRSTSPSISEVAALKARQLGVQFRGAAGGAQHHGLLRTFGAPRG